MLSFILKGHLNGDKVSFYKTHTSCAALRENLIKKGNQMMKWNIVNNVSERKGSIAINKFTFGNRGNGKAIMNSSWNTEKFKHILFKIIKQEERTNMKAQVYFM